MRFEEIANAIPEGIKTSAQIAAAADFLLAAEDMPSEERSAFITGQLIGMTYVLAAYNEHNMLGAARRVQDFLATYTR